MVSADGSSGRGLQLAGNIRTDLRSDLPAARSLLSSHQRVAGCLAGTAVGLTVAAHELAWSARFRQPALEESRSEPGVASAASVR